MLMGPNGAGKSSLLKMIHGLEPIREGKIVWPSNATDFREQQSFVFQSPIIMRRTVFENLIYPLRLRKISPDERTKRGEFWLERIGLADMRNADAMYLSGGEKQKLALARALIIKPQLLFLDEPTANLDGGSTFLIEKIIKEIADQDVRVIMSTHDLMQGKRLADEVVFLNKGNIVEISPGTEFFENPRSDLAKRFLDGEILI
ncbi:ATP-binding cassette domain-containing protein [Sneathiella sp. P13V-1]|nr:ATP-binding cassette domain-containing protein [Sneathiella sp. P13V-1]